MLSERVPDSTVELRGDAVVLLTAPFYPRLDPLVERPGCSLPSDGVLDDRALLTQTSRPMDALLRGSLTYGSPPLPALTHFEGSDSLRMEICSAAELPSELTTQVDLRGVLFSDGYGAVAVHVAIPSGWDQPQRDLTLEAFGPAGRERTAAAIRDVLLGPLTQLTDRCGGAAADVEFPYFNQTYIGHTAHEHPGRAPLADHLRELVYPRSADPTTSDSPWYDEFFYAGYAYNLLASAAPQTTSVKLEMLLLHLDVLYARLARSAAAADLAIREQVVKGSVDWLVQLDLRLRGTTRGSSRPPSALTSTCSSCGMRC